MEMRPSHAGFVCNAIMASVIVLAFITGEHSDTGRRLLS